MFISNSRRFVFVHITKAAGTTVTMALDKSFQWNDLALGGTTMGEAIQEPYRARFDFHKHSSAREIRAVIGHAVWDDYFTFSFVRHPYSRAVSLYTFIGRTLRESGYRRYRPWTRDRSQLFWEWPGTKAYLASRSFSDFIRHPEFLRAPGMRPQTDWLCDDDGKLMVDFVGKVESIDTDFAQVAERVGLERPEVTTHNRSAVRSWTKYLNADADYAHLHDLFRPDFELFGYDPELRG